MRWTILNMDAGTENLCEIPSSLSKRGARRVIQRAVVLIGRDKALRQKLRSVELTTRWLIEEWGLEWTVVVDQGHIEFHRGHVGKAQVNILWKTGDHFLGQLEAKSAPTEGFELECEPGLRRVVDMVFQSFLGTLRKVLVDPVDDAGVRLL